METSQPSGADGDENSNNASAEVGLWYPIAEAPTSQDHWLVLAQHVGCVWAIKPPNLSRADTHVYLCAKPLRDGVGLHCHKHRGPLTPAMFERS
jgi:hypothetical protein